MFSKSSAICYLIIFFTSFLCAHDVRAESSKENTPLPVQIKAERINPPDTADIPKEIKFEQGNELVIPSIPIKNEGGFEKQIKPNDTPSVAVNNQGAFKTRPVSNYKGGPVTDTRGNIIPAVIAEPAQVKMKKVKNLGKPEGEIAKAQSVKDVAVHTDSDKLMRLEEKRLKRKAVIKKTLENSESRKALKNREAMRGEHEKQ